MSLARVEITSDVFWTCVTHALTTEAEEIMGLLLGDIKEQPDGSSIARIWFAMPQIRTDRRKDRVEASPEQMVRCAAQAEEYSKQRGVRIRVIGWYHSHPHITVLPSHVDVRTQATYQQLDEGFVGLIFSTFDEDATSLAQRVQVTAFQSVPAASKNNYSAVADDYDAAMAAAMAASQCDHGGGDGSWSRKEVPLEVIQTEQVSERSDNLFGLMRVLFREEQAAFRRAITASSDNTGAIHPLAAIHFGATYQQHMCQLIELVLGPTVQALENYKTQVHLQMQRLKQLEAELKNRLSDTESQLALEAGNDRQPASRRLSHFSSQAMDPQPSLHLALSQSYGLEGIQGRPGSAAELLGSNSAAAALPKIVTDLRVPAPGPGSPTAQPNSSDRLKEMRDRLDRLRHAASPPPPGTASPQDPEEDSPFATEASRSLPLPDTRHAPPGSSTSLPLPGDMDGGTITGVNPAFGAAEAEPTAPPPLRRIMTAGPSSRPRTADELRLPRTPTNVLEATMINPLADSLDDTLSLDGERPSTGNDADKRERRRDKLVGSMMRFGTKAGGKLAKGLGVKSSKGKQPADAGSSYAGSVYAGSEMMDTIDSDVHHLQDSQPNSPDGEGDELAPLSTKAAKKGAGEAEADPKAKPKRRSASLARIF